MGAMNPVGHVLVAASAGEEDGSVNELWDLLAGLFDVGVVVHSFTEPELRDPRTARFCVHLTEGSTGLGEDLGQEFRADTLRTALLAAAMWRAEEMGDIMIPS
jgi:hypothetical protein